MQLKSLRRYFINGLLFLLPIGLTVWFLVLAVTKVDEISLNFLKIFLGEESILLKEENYVFGISLLITATLIYIIGWLATNYFGNLFTKWIDKIFEMVPLANKVYQFVKQITNTLNKGGGSAFQRVVLIEYHRKDLWVMGLVSNDSLEGILGEKAGAGKIAVFIPTSPNPTSGFVAMVDEKDTIPLDLSVEEGLKVVISGGSLGAEEPEGELLGAKA